ncbi:MAG TPA: DUF2491 family protein [Rhodopila sp.]|nr:DUF2491 family protein [Rhodopila sp.]
MGSYRGPSGAGDTGISQRRSAEALRDYRSSITPPRPSAPATPYGNEGSLWGNSQRRPEPMAPPGSWWGQSRSYPVPPQAYPGSRSRYGSWDAVVLWSLLNAVTSTRSNEFFRQNQTDPGYRQWRADADRLAANDPALASKLDQLDQQLAQQSSRVPPPADGGGSELVLFILVVGGGGLLLLWWMRRRIAVAAVKQVPAQPGITGSAQNRLRVGMTIPIDPSAFILAGGTTKVTPPAETEMVSIEAIGLLRDGTRPEGAVLLHRLYLPGRACFFHMHLDAGGRTDECRYFSRLDQVAPASRDEWAFWLDPAQGMIGWPEFQTKDGKLYGRAWAPGSDRIPPRDQAETIRDLAGEQVRSLHAMLYAAPTGAQPPAPQTEYLLLEAVEQEGQAFVDIHVGIDINPQALSLPALPAA